MIHINILDVIYIYDVIIVWYTYIYDTYLYDVSIVWYIYDVRIFDVYMM